MSDKQMRSWFLTLSAMISIGLHSSSPARGVTLSEFRFGVIVQGQSPIVTFSEDAGVVLGEIPFNAAADPPFTVTPTSGKTRGRDQAFAISVPAGTPPGTYVNKKIRIVFHQRTGDDVKERTVSVAVVPNPVLSATVVVVAIKNLTSSNIDFGSVVAGNRVSRRVEIKNNSASQVAIKAELTGNGANLIAMKSSPTASLAPGASHAIDFDFPLQFNLGQAVATLNVSSEVVGLPVANVPVPAPAGRLLVPMKGTVLSSINIPTVLDFGTVSLNSSQQKFLDIVNLASSRVIISVPSTAGPFQLAPTRAPLDTAGARASIVVTLPAQQSAGILSFDLSVAVGDLDQQDIPELKKVTIKATVVP